MKDNFDECLALTLKYEGGFANDPHDPGGATNYGITIGTLSAYFGRPAKIDEVRALKLDTVARIYRANYWVAIQGDMLPLGLDCAVFDFAVNSGVKRAIIGLQRTLDIADDGVLGPITLTCARTSVADHTIMGVTADRLGMLRKLSTWPRYGRGWTTRVVAVQKTAHNMALSAANQPSV